METLLGLSEEAKRVLCTIPQDKLVALLGSGIVLDSSVVRRQLTELLEEVSGGKRIIIKKYGDVVAAIVPIEDYLKLILGGTS